MKRKYFFNTLLLTALTFTSFAASPEKILVKNGEKILFAGDSITQFGNRPDGFIHLVMDGLKRSGVQKLSCIPGGRGGDRSYSLLKRLKHLLARKPQWIVLQIGVNDVGWGPRGATLPQYKGYMKQILDQCSKAGVKIMLVTPTLCRERLSNPNNKVLEGYCDFVRQEAARRKLPLADWNKVMRETLLSGKIRGDRDRVLTIDSLHLNGYGNLLLAQTILKAFKVDASKVGSFAKEWKKIPSMAPVLNSWGNPKIKISINDFERLYKAASAKKMPVSSYMEKVIYDHIRSLKK